MSFGLGSPRYMDSGSSSLALRKHGRHRMTEPDPFAKAVFRRQVARIEFDAFQENAEIAIRAACNKVPRFQAIEQHYSFYIKIFHQDTVQVWFGKRPMFCKDIDGRGAVECGACLLYSLGPTGDVIVTMYPCRSTLAKVAEDRIYIGLGRFSAYQILKRIDSDVRTLVAYCYVSSLDAEASWNERLWIAWLRRIKPSEVDGKFVAGSSALVGSTLREFYRAALLGAFTAILRPVGYVAVALVLIHLLGKEHWTEFFMNN